MLMHLEQLSRERKAPADNAAFPHDEEWMRIVRLLLALEIEKNFVLEKSRSPGAVVAMKQLVPLLDQHFTDSVKKQVKVNFSRVEQMEVKVPES